MRENSVIKANILQYLEYKGISKYKFYQETGITNGILSQKNGLSEENTLRFLSRYSDISPRWLLTGEGEMLSTRADERQVTTPIAHIQESNKNKLIPLVHEKAVAGFGGKDFNISEQDVKDYYVIPKFKNYNIDFMIEVHGSSMYPKYNSGDVIACTVIRNSQFIQWNKCHVIATTEQGILVKRLKPCDNDDASLLAISDNKEYPPFKIPKSEITGIALVAGVIRLE